MKAKMYLDQFEHDYGKKESLEHFIIQKTKELIANQE